MIKKYRNYILIILGSLLILTMLIGVDYLMKSKKEGILEVKLREITDSKDFAIMIQKGDTYEEYNTEDNTWPGADYVYKEAKCTDNNGVLVNDVVTFTDGKATLTTNQTVYCTLYFDIKPKPTIEILRENDSGKYLSTVLQGEMYRYQGLYTDEINNYICLGDNCCNTESCPYDSNDDMYRIIGITESGEIKVIKKTSSGSAYHEIAQV